MIIILIITQNNLNFRSTDYIGLSNEILGQEGVGKR
jgi:hypothetical protein